VLSECSDQYFPLLFIANFRQPISGKRNNLIGRPSRNTWLEESAEERAGEYDAKGSGNHERAFAFQWDGDRGDQEEGALIIR